MGRKEQCEREPGAFDPVYIEASEEKDGKGWPDIVGSRPFLGFALTLARRWKRQSLCKSIPPVTCAAESSLGRGGPKGGGRGEREKSNCKEWNGLGAKE